MVNHPHDCPVCDEGGECHLQDMTVMSGHNARRYRFTKRTHRNQDLGPFVNHEMNRCIACYRCVRYYKDYAGGSDLGVFGAHDNVYFGRVADGQLEHGLAASPHVALAADAVGVSLDYEWACQERIVVHHRRDDVEGAGALRRHRFRLRGKLPWRSSHG